MIRKSNEKDISRIAEILIFTKRTAYRDIFKNDKVSFGEMLVLPLAMKYMENAELLKNIYVYDDEIVKGMMNISLEKQFEINQLYIDPFFQNQKIGSKLLSYAENYAKELGHNKIFLWVLEKNKSGRRFYEKHGFIITNEKKLEDGTTEYILKYEKQIP